MLFQITLFVCLFIASFLDQNKLYYYYKYFPYSKRNFLKNFQQNH